MRLLVLASLIAVLPAAADAQHRRQPEWRQAREERINVSLGRFHPGIIELRRDIPTRLIFYNSGRGPLSVAAPRFFGSSWVRSGDADVVARGAFIVRPGEERAILLVPAAGQYRLRSGSLYRRFIGMSAQIVVR